MKKRILCLTIAMTTIATSGCAPFWHGVGRHGVGRGARLVEQSIINDNLIKEVTNNEEVDKTQLVTLLN